MYLKFLLCSCLSHTITSRSFSNIRRWFVEKMASELQNKCKHKLELMQHWLDWHKHFWWSKQSSKVIFVFKSLKVAGCFSFQVTCQSTRIRFVVESLIIYVQRANSNQNSKWTGKILNSFFTFQRFPLEIFKSLKEHTLFPLILRKRANWNNLKKFYKNSPVKCSGWFSRGLFNSVFNAWKIILEFLQIPHGN